MVTVTLPISINLNQYDSTLLQEVKNTGILEESIVQLIDGILEQLHDKKLSDSIAGNKKIQSLTSQLSGM